MGLRESIILPFVPRFVLIFKPIRIMSDDLMRILVVEPTKDPYETWNQIRDELNECYSPCTPREHLPLSQQKEFRRIKNDIIREAENIRLGLPTFEDEKMRDEPEETQEEHPTSGTWEQAQRCRAAQSVLQDVYALDEEHAEAAGELERLWAEGYDKFDIAHGDTLVSPQHWDDEPFEAIVSNPPYSIRWEGSDNATLINDPRFSPAGVLAPKSKADLAFIMHSLSWLATDGTAAIVCFPGVMYRGGAEKQIRKYLIDNNFIDCIIQLPDNLFYGTTIATCIMVLKKSKRDNHTLFLDASKQCVKITNSNKLTEDNIQTILTAYLDRADKPHFAALVPNDKIAEQDYNLSVSTYVEQEDTREVIDIQKLNAEIAQIVAREQKLREEIDKIVAEIEGGNENE